MTYYSVIVFGCIGTFQCMHTYMICLLHKLLMLSIFMNPEMCLHKSRPVIPELSALATITIVLSAKITA